MEEFPIFNPISRILDKNSSFYLAVFGFQPVRLWWRSGDALRTRRRETDPEFWGGAVSYKYRVEDTRLGRFFSGDPLAAEYPWNSPYAFSENRVMDGVELEGLEYLSVTQAEKLGFGLELSNEGTKMSWGEMAFGTYERTYFGGKHYLNLGYHLYFDGTNPSLIGKRSDQITVETKIGATLSYNFFNLPKAPKGYLRPPTYSNPEKSWAVANTYQDCWGMCFAVSMARYNQAYKNVTGKHSDLLTQVNPSTDYALSGTILGPSLPDNLFGYGVAGALANKRYAELVTEEEIWEGKLQIGAIVQWWAFPTFAAAKNSNFKREGHSGIFRDYSYDQDGNINGLKFFDYKGFQSIDKGAFKAAGFSIVGGNLIDPNENE
ncbi:MAG: hypothetical protein SF052_16085 [Bacteroidia bacterium]|nr:hypothetical protein [Bacteroidia bacterium]